MAEYILRADTSEGPVYYMNFITVTSLRINARPFKTKEEAQDAHEAIRPISLERNPESLKGKIDNNLYRLYKLIYERD